MKNLLNWNAISRILTGSRHSVRKNQIPKKHRAFIADLIKAVQEVCDRHGVSVDEKNE